VIRLFVTMMPAEHYLAELVCVVRYLRVYNFNSRFVDIERGKHLPHPHARDYVVIAFRHKANDFLVTLQRLVNKPPPNPDTGFYDLRESSVCVQLVTIGRSYCIESVKVLKVAKLANNCVL